MGNQAEKSGSGEPQMFVKVAAPLIGEDEITAAREALLSGHLVSGPRVAEFERNFASYIGVKHAVAVNSGTAALHAALAALGIGPGDEVIVPALTFFSTATAVIHQGAVPVFADISLDNFCMCPRDLETRITPRTKAVIPVHYFGHAAEMNEINRIAEENNLYVIEDCAQSHGTTYHGRQTGQLGHMGAFSFFATKHITTGGEGGVVTTDNDEWAEYMRRFRSHGMHGRDDHIMLGYNYRMTEAAGAIGNVQLTKLDDFNRDRIRASENLIGKISGYSWLQTPSVPDHVQHTYFWCHLLIDEKELGMTTQELINRLREKGIEVRHRYTEPLYRQPLLTKNPPRILELSAGDNLPDYGAMFLPNSERAAGRVIGLPNRPDISSEEIDYIAQIFQEIDAAR